MLQIEHQEQFSQLLRHRCRNPRCRMKLKAPVDNPHKAFCTKGCYDSFYLKRCVVCEKEKPSGRSDRKFCRRPKCRTEYHKNPGLFGETASTITLRTDSSKSADSTGIKTGGLDDRPWQIVAGPVISANTYHCAAIPIDPDRANRVAAANDWDRIRSEIAWSPRRPPSPVDVTTHSRWQPSWQPQWPSPTDDLPKFLKREPGS